MPLEQTPSPDLPPSQENPAPSPEAIEERDQEFQEQKEEQSDAKAERDKQEEAEHYEEVEQADTALDLAIGLESYNECINFLHGDAKEVMIAVDTQLSEEEKSKIGMGIMEFSQTCMKNRAKREGQQPSAQEMKVTQAHILQNSIDYIIEEAQNMNNDPVSQQEEFAEEVNEKNIREFTEQTKAETVDALDNVLNLCGEEILKQVAAGKILSSKRLERIQERRKGGNSALNTDEVMLLDQIAAENLSHDLKALKKDETTATVKSEEGDILETPQDFAKNKDALVVTWKGKTDSVKEAAQQKNIRLAQTGETLEVRGSLYQIDRLVDAMKKAPKKKTHEEK